MYYFKTYHALPDDARVIRETVFINEQGFSDEFDETDAVAKHIVLYDEKGTAIGTVRYFKSGEDTYIIGRVAVLKEFRKNNYGAIMLQEAEEQIKACKGKKIRLAAQVQAKGFYEKSGYKDDGHEFMEEHCRHIWMEKEL